MRTLPEGVRHQLDGSGRRQRFGVTAVTPNSAAGSYYTRPWTPESTRMVWARLQADLNCNLRRGAWYRLIKADGLAAVVDVKGTPVPVVRAFLQMSNTPPRKWTVVPRPRNVPRSVQVGVAFADLHRARHIARARHHGPDGLAAVVDVKGTPVPLV